MRIGRSFLLSKVARRVLLSFVLCALLPVGALAVLSLARVSDELRDASLRRLQHDCKERGMSIIERVNLLDAELRSVVVGMRSDRSFHAGLENSRIHGMVLRVPGGALRRVTGEVTPPPLFTSDQNAHLKAHGTILAHAFAPNGNASVFLARMLDPTEPHLGVLVAEVNADYLLGVDGLAPSRQLAVVDHAGRYLGGTRRIPGALARAVTGQRHESLQWIDGETPYEGAHWPVFLKANYMAPAWNVVLSEPESVQLAPTADFERTFYLVILLSVWVVLLLSIVQIRRTLGPIAVLRDGTKRITSQDFNHRVEVTSGDEFEELGAAFNTMADRVGRQFQVLRMRTELQRTILASLDTPRIIETVLEKLPTLVECDAMCVALLDPDDRTFRTFVRTPDDNNVETEGALDAAELLSFDGDAAVHAIQASPDVAGFLEPLMRDGVRHAAVLPVIFDLRVSVVVALGYREKTTPSPEDIAQVHQLTGLMVVGLSNAHLVEELDELNWGTLAALSRAIDAKSAWTMGHSDRVTDLATRIGAEMHLPRSQMQTLRRGALLHDIGKIGTPASILDKPEKLTPEEVDTMNDHVRLGALILEPIRQFADVLPIVLEHHERFDGSGYPAGLSGEQISVEARIVAVADCYDALGSERPYRKGLTRQEVTGVIKRCSGTHFDPAVVDAFLRVIDQRQRETALAAVEDEGLRR